MVRELVVASLLATPVVASNTGEITVRVFNYSEAPATVLEAAKFEVTAMYDQAGVALKWLNCAGLPDLAKAEVCAQTLSPGGHALALRIVSHFAVDPRNAARNGVNVLGYSTGAYTT